MSKTLQSISKTLPLSPLFDWSGNSLLGDTNIEVHNTIVKQIGPSGLYAIDALTNEEWLRVLAIKCDEGERDAIIRSLLARAQPAWKKPRTMVFWGFGSKELPTLPSTPTEAAGTKEAVEQNQNDWVLSDTAIIERLESKNTDLEERITAVLFAETTSFPDRLKPRLLPLLMEFAINNRFSKNDEVITAVGAAIRKFAMNMPTSEFEAYSSLFSTTATETLSCDLELELAKAIGWRLTTVGNVASGQYPNLEARLSELASDYLTSRLVLQENYASIVLHAIVSVALLNGARQDEFVGRIAKLGIDWFKTLFAKRLVDVARKRRNAVSHDDGNLDRLVRLLETAGS